MKPEVEIRYNHDYAKRLYNGKEGFEDAWNKLILQGGKFEELYEECINKILEVIPKITGYEWQEYADKFIPIYLVVDGASFSPPFTLKLEDELGETFVSLIYQLVHCNMFFGFSSLNLKDDIYIKTVSAVAEEIGIDLKEEISDYILKNEIKIEQSDWDPRRESAKGYLSKK
jgi:hypothetical protein